MPRATQCTEYRGVKKTQSLYRIDHTLLILFTRLYGALYVVSHVRGSGYVPRPPTAAQRPAPTHDAARRRQGVARHCESVLGLRTPPATTLQPPKVSRVSYAVRGTAFYEAYGNLHLRVLPYWTVFTTPPAQSTRGRSIRGCAMRVKPYGGPYLKVTLLARCGLALSGLDNTPRRSKVFSVELDWH